MMMMVVSSVVRCGVRRALGHVGCGWARGAAAVRRAAPLSTTAGLAVHRKQCVMERQTKQKHWQADAIREQMQKHAMDTSTMTVVEGKDGACILGRPVGPLAMNQYIVFCEETKEAAIVDSGIDTIPDFLDIVAKEDLKVKYLLQTHAHPDHVAGLAFTKKQFPEAEVVMHKADLHILNAAPSLGQAFGLAIEAPPQPDTFVEDGAEVQVGTLCFRVMHTPGHCPGHVCFHDPKKGILFSGDLLFKGTVGRTDLPSSDSEAMKQSLRRIVREVRASPQAGQDDDTHIFPGHMEPTTMHAELRINPFLMAFRREAGAALMA